MEYNTIFGTLDFDTVRSGSFQDKLGRYITLAKIIYNGFKYNFGSEDGAVTITNNFTLWKFIAPVNRLDMTHFAPLTLRESLTEIVQDTETAPIPAWDTFFQYLADPAKEQMVNQVIHGCSVVRIGYRDTDLPLIKGCTNFSSFMRWLGENSGEAGDLPSSTFINGQDMIIPLDQYSATPVRFTLRHTPKEQPNDYGSDVGIIAVNDNVVCYYGTKSGFYSSPVFYSATDDTQTLIYAFNDTTDTNGATINAGWSVYDGTSYATVDSSVVDDVVIEYDDTIGYSYLTKIFFDIEYETYEASVYHVNDTIDLSAIPLDFVAGAYNFEMSLTETDTQRALIIYTGTSEDNVIMYAYVENAETFEGVTLSAGWNTMDLNTEEIVSYDMVENPLALDLIDGEYEISDVTAFEIIATYQGTESKVKERHDGTIYFMLRA